MTITVCLSLLGWVPIRNGSYSPVLKKASRDWPPAKSRLIGIIFAFGSYNPFKGCW